MRMGSPSKLYLMGKPANLHGQIVVQWNAWRIDEDHGSYHEREGVPDAFEGANAGDDGDLTLELAGTRTCGKVGLNLGDTGYCTFMMFLWRRPLFNCRLLCRCHYGSRKYKQASKRKPVSMRRLLATGSDFSLGPLILYLG